MGHSDAHRTAPDLPIVDDKTGDEILVFAGRHTVLEADANSPCNRSASIAGMVGKANDAVGVGDIDPLRIVAGRKERNAERPIESACENLVRGGLCRVIGGAEHADPTGARFGHEDVAIRREAGLRAQESAPSTPRVAWSISST